MVTSTNQCSFQILVFIILLLTKQIPIINISLLQETFKTRRCSVWLASLHYLCYSDNYETKKLTIMKPDI